MTFDELIEAEPKLKQLRDEALEIASRANGNYGVRSEIWYCELKPRFVRLVGFMAERPELGSCEAYDTAYQGFCNILRI